MRPAAQSSLATVAPSVQFPITICVLCYGDHTELAERFLRSLYGTVEPTLFTLRIGLNAVSARTDKLAREYQERHGNIEIFASAKNIFKNPMMRRLFYEKPLESKWTIWCDDDTHFTRRDWLQRLALKIEQSPNIAMWGATYRLWTDDRKILGFIRGATWHRGMDFRTGNDLEGKKAPEFRFVTGAFWAIKTEIIHRLNWPDPRLIQAGEDFIFGEALRQNRYVISHFCHGISVNDAPRRNESAPEQYTLGT